MVPIGSYHYLKHGPGVNQPGIFHHRTLTSPSMRRKQKLHQGTLLTRHASCFGWGDANVLKAYKVQHTMDKQDNHLVPESDLSAFSLSLSLWEANDHIPKYIRLHLCALALLLGKG